MQFSSDIGRLHKLFVTSIFKKVIKKDGITLQFSEYDKVIIGNKLEKNIVIRPPNIAALIYMLINPMKNVGNAYVKEYFSIVSGDVKDFIELLFRQNRHSMLPSIAIYLSRLGRPYDYLLYKFDFATRHRLKEHYNIPTHIYKFILEDELIYTCAVFNTPEDSLKIAQRNKINMISERLQLGKIGLRVLDIGCGWGYISHYFATTFKCNVDAITISHSQFDYCINKYKINLTDVNVPHFYLAKYQDFKVISSNCYDRIFSIGVFEHFGRYNHLNYFRTISKLLRTEGICLTHCVVSPEIRRPNSWIEKYIFPGLYVPTMSQVIKAIEMSKLRIIGCYVIDPYNYARTINIWRSNMNKNFVPKNNNETKIKKIMNFYLAASEVSFIDCNIGFQVCQFVCKKID